MVAKGLNRILGHIVRVVSWPIIEDLAVFLLEKYEVTLQP